MTKCIFQIKNYKVSLEVKVWRMPYLAIPKRRLCLRTEDRNPSGQRAIAVWAVTSKITRLLVLQERHILSQLVYSLLLCFKHFLELRQLTTYYLTKLELVPSTSLTSRQALSFPSDCLCPNRQQIHGRSKFSINWSRNKMDALGRP